MTRQEWALEKLRCQDHFVGTDLEDAKAYLKVLGYMAKLTKPQHKQCLAELEEYFASYDNEGEDLSEDRTKYMKKGKRDFIKKINNIYDEYNLLKSDFIKNEFKEKNDDIIDKNILYKDDDNYKYKKKSEYY